MPQRSGTAREVIAHFSMPSLVLAWLGWLGFIIIALYLLRHEIVTAPVVTSRDRMGHGLDGIGHVLKVGLLVTLSGGLLSFFPRMFKLTRGAVSAGADALWIEHGRLTYADKKLLDVLLTDVMSVELLRERIYAGTIIPQYASWIVIQLKGGKKVKLPPKFVENRDDVIAILRGKLDPAAVS